MVKEEVWGYDLRAMDARKADLSVVEDWNEVSFSTDTRAFGGDTGGNDGRLLPRGGAAGQCRDQQACGQQAGDGFFHIVPFLSFARRRDGPPFLTDWQRAVRRKRAVRIQGTLGLQRP